MIKRGAVTKNTFPYRKSIKYDLIHFLNKTIMNHNNSAMNVDQVLIDFVNSQAVNMSKFSEDITIMTYACEPKTHQWVSSRCNIHSDQCTF